MFSHSAVRMHIRFLTLALFLSPCISSAGVEDLTGTYYYSDHKPPSDSIVLKIEGGLPNADSDPQLVTVYKVRGGIVVSRRTGKLSGGFYKHGNRKSEYVVLRVNPANNDHLPAILRFQIKPGGKKTYFVEPR